MVVRYLLGDLPEALRPLEDLALDLRWTWSHEADEIWQRLDPETWARTRSPWVLLQIASREKLEDLARDREFVRRVRELADAREAYLSGPAWFHRTYPRDHLGGVAYFSMEFGLGSALPLYAGGLGILAGDHLKSASDLGVPLVGIGLLYQEGYFRQMIDPEGLQHETYPNNEPSSLPIEPVLNGDGGLLRIPLALPGRRLILRVWKAMVGRVSLFLLDANDPANTPFDRGITSQLYGGGTEVRMMQEIVLGVGGCRMLATLGLDPEVFHLNEGHAAFAVLERARNLRRRTGMTFREAMWACRAGNVFTTHTSVAAAFDTFPQELIDRYAPYFKPFVEEAGITADELLSFGRLNVDANEPFNMAYLAVRGSRFVNGVSRLHGDVSRQIFSSLFPRWPSREVPIGHITNGVHVPSWDSPWADAVWTRTCGKERWRGSVDDLPDPLAEVSDEEIWSIRMRQRADLVTYARKRIAEQSSARGTVMDSVAASSVLDPNALTLGFARRFTEYKRPDLLLRDPERLKRLLTDPNRPVQLVVAGKAHPRDSVGKKALQRWVRFAEDPVVRPHVAFIEDYDMTVSEHMVQGVDLWINTPRRPWEACGTSGMKVLVNGGLNLSTLDGWWDEAWTDNVGWAIGERGNGLHDADDEADAEQTYRLLEREVVPLFYDRDGDGVPRAWIQRIRSSMCHLTPRFSGNRMVQEYVESAYLPAAEAYRARLAQQGRLARDLAAWEQRVRACWPHVRFGSAEVTQDEEGRQQRVQVYLGELDPDDVAIEVYAESVDGKSAVTVPLEVEREIPGAVHGYVFQGQLPPDRTPEDFTPRAVPRFDGVHAPAELPLVHWQR